MKKILFVYAIYFAAISSALAASSHASKHFQRVIQVVMENENYDDVLEQADFAAWAKKGLLLTNLRAEVHPSQGNYIAMIAGNSYGIHNDNVVNLEGRHLGDILEEAGLDWRVYAEAYPGNCFLGSSSGTYFRKHNPFLSFTSVSQNPERCGKIVNGDQFEADLKSNTLPAYSLYIPDIKNDGHDTGLDFGGKWFTKKFGALLENPQFMQGTLLILTFDESANYFNSNQVYTVLFGGAVRAGGQNSQALTHASLLRLLEDELSLGSLEQEDLSSPALQGIWL